MKEIFQNFSFFFGKNFQKKFRTKFLNENSKKKFGKFKKKIHIINLRTSEKRKEKQKKKTLGLEKFFFQNKSLQYFGTSKKNL